MDRTAVLVQLDAVADELTRRGETDLARKTREAVAALRSADAAPDFVTTGEAARLLGVRSINTVKAWVRDGLLEGSQVGGRVKVSRESIERMLESAVLARERAWEREVAEVLDAFDAGDLPLPPSDVSRMGRAPWDRRESRRP